MVTTVTMAMTATMATMVTTAMARRMTLRRVTTPEPPDAGDSPGTFDSTVRPTNTLLAR
jgi:hypothetical protein